MDVVAAAGAQSSPDPSTLVGLDPIIFIRELVDPETGKPFDLYPEEERFLRLALTLTPDGRLPYPELLYGAIKKSGKTALEAMVLLYIVLVIGGKYAEGYCVANDLEQAQGRVFQACARIAQASPLVRRELQGPITKGRIEFKNGRTIVAVSNDAAGNAGANPSVSGFDELWGYTSERAHRLWDEMVPPPTRQVAARITVTYAGFEGESDLLWKLYQRGLKGTQIAPDLYEQPGMLMFWSHRACAPWQTEAWQQQMREQLRPNAYLRMIENRWVTTESGFVDIDWWDACVEPDAHPLVSCLDQPVIFGVDASVKRDATALVGAVWDHQARMVRVVWHRIFQPSPESPLDFEATIEATLLELRRRFQIREVRFDPYQMIASAQRLSKAGLPMVEFPQTPANLTEASSNLFELIKGRNLRVYPDADMRLAISRAIAIEGTRGWRIAKEKSAHKIDVVVALAQAALGAVRKGTVPQIGWIRTLR